MGCGRRAPCEHSGLKASEYGTPVLGLIFLRFADAKFSAAREAIDSGTIGSLLRHINGYTKDLEGDAFGLVYEYFLANFALAEGQGAGEFFTPPAIVRLIVEIIEPYRGRIFDPACGSGGMFVQSAHFVERHRRSPGEELSI